MFSLSSPRTDPAQKTINVVSLDDRAGVIGSGNSRPAEFEAALEADAGFTDLLPDSLCFGAKLGGARRVDAYVREIGQSLLP